jgi:Type II CAAX prenyl endopeptidase Rce1-like
VPVALGMLVVVSAVMAFIAVGRGGMTVVSGSQIVQAARWTRLYLPVCFMLEEVTFRGALDSYLWRPGEKDASYSTIEISFLWGLWHLPIVPIEGSLFFALLVGCWHVLPGSPLSLSWRTGGNLLVPAAAHAALDGVRNALLIK